MGAIRIQKKRVAAILRLAENSCAWAQSIEFKTVPLLPVYAWAPKAINIAMSFAPGRKTAAPGRKFTFQVAYLSPNIRF